MGDMEIKVNWRLFDDEINMVNIVFVFFVKVFRLNGFRFVFGIVV